MSFFLSPLIQLPNTFRVFYGSFTTLYPIQSKAIAPILAQQDLLIQSATGSGKTEAVLAPCAEQLIQSKGSKSALYIIPTRALALDIHRRFEKTFAERLGLCFAIRTGDVKRAKSGCPDIMLTTPESLDVMMGSENPDIRKFLLRIQMVILDEIHPFIHQPRGQQLVYLLQRLTRRTNRPIQRIALSATMGDPHRVLKFLQFRDKSTILVEKVSRQIHPRIIHIKDEKNGMIDFVNDLYNNWNYRKILIFANSRGRCDQLYALLNHNGQFQGVTELHYSNLKAKERQAVESRFRKHDHSVCVATSTLELGIDVGDVDAVILFEPPDSVSSFLQRIGRANRRQQTIHFWGICRGENAGLQTLRFLALLNLGRTSNVEAELPKILPSVLSQQIISCLYEKKILSPASIEDLFQGQKGIVDTIPLSDLFKSLLQKRWLKETNPAGLYKGGRKYGEALLEHRIWSNFPESEQEYRLEIQRESVADIPLSIVNQFEPGDRIFLAGRALRILCVDNNNRVVIAEPTSQLDRKELYWLGTGCHVSYEVAQTMHHVLNTNLQDMQKDGLFSRNKRLLKEEQKKHKQTALLDNGIEVILTANNQYNYRTFLGSVGNIILTCAIKYHMNKTKPDSDFSIDSDEISVSCSHWIHFENLSLPTTIEEFPTWISVHYRKIRAIFALNAFCSTLPKNLLQQELAGFMSDPRLLTFFQKLLTGKSNIIRGNLEPPPIQDITSERQKNIIDFFDITNSGLSLLSQEKERWHNTPSLTVPKNAKYLQKPITGTLLSDYFRHHQCQRLLHFYFLAPQYQPVSQNDDTNKTLAHERIAQGKLFESEVLKTLEQENTILHISEKEDTTGKLRSLKERFQETQAILLLLAEKAQKGINLSTNNTYIVQAVLMVEKIVQTSCITFSDQNREIGLTGIGIVDLIRIKQKKEGLLLEVVDIKRSNVAQYHQKWQIAFYSYLLKTLLKKLQRSKQLPINIEIANSGFLVTYSINKNVPQWHSIDLRPYHASLPALLSNCSSTLASPWSAAYWHVQGHCSNCIYFNFCYQQALQEEEIQFLPDMTPGLLEKMRSSRIKTIQDGVISLISNEQKDYQELSFTPQQKEKIQAVLTCFHDNKIGITQEKTKLYPSNISLFLFIHIFFDPISGYPSGIGFARKKRGEQLQVETWMLDTETSLQHIWKNFSHRFFLTWKRAIDDNQGPHVFLFGSQIPQRIRQWANEMEDNALKDFFSPSYTCHWTDLQYVLKTHFIVPILGRRTLFGFNFILGSQHLFQVPESLVHGDFLPLSLYQDEKEKKDIKTYLENTLTCLSTLQKWTFSYLESEVRIDNWHSISSDNEDKAVLYKEFIEYERDHKEREILALQELSFQERAAQFRTLGPLVFTGTSIDEEGRFLSLFSVDDEAIVTKFRPGDFLRLVPLGMKNFQQGIPVILIDYQPLQREVALYSRQHKGIKVSPGISYSLEEDTEDWNTPKLLNVVQDVYVATENHPLVTLFDGGWNYQQLPEATQWTQQWLTKEGAIAGLNESQQHALQLPFRYSLSLIQGPPGTGKTNLLGWILIALFRYAQEQGNPLRIAVTCLTHQAIDQVLSKVVNLANKYTLPNFSPRCVKLGKWDKNKLNKDNDRQNQMQVEAIKTPHEVLADSHLILGATGYALYNAFRKKGNPNYAQKYFDWIIFDEASQILVPQALLSMIYGKGNYLFLGDIYQLPPVICSNLPSQNEEEKVLKKRPSLVNPESSLLETLFNLYPKQNACLNTTYRMNAELCVFPSKTWYKGKLQPAAKNKNARLSLKSPEKGSDFLDHIIDPQKPVALILVNHKGAHQQSDVEANIVALMTERLLDQGINKEEIAIISPHRAQNNAIRKRLHELLPSSETLPLIDTVERVQGAERDVIFFGFTASDPDRVLSDFLNNPNRFNVAITRARKKLIVIGSTTFFSTIAQSEKKLLNNTSFKQFLYFCRTQECCFELPPDFPLTYG